MSRELDAKLAVKFGYKISEDGTEVYQPDHGTTSNFADREVAEMYMRAVVPSYSTTYEGMGLVIEEMRKRGWDVALHLPSVDCGHKPYVLLTGPEKRHDALSGPYEADTAPLAVAKAALAALEAE